MEHLEESFSAIVGREPSEASRQRLYRLRDALGLRDNDALWSILFALESYQELYDEVPGQIASETRALLKELRETSEAVAAASMEASKKRLSEAVTEIMTKVARDVAGKQRAVAGRRLMEWIAVAVVVLFASAAGLSVWMHRVGWQAGYAEGSASGYKLAQEKEGEAGFARGRVAGYEAAKSEKAAMAWANTPEGKLAQELSRAGSLHLLARCSGRGWRIQNGACYPHPENGKVEGWRLMAEDRDDGRPGR